MTQNKLDEIFGKYKDYTFIDDNHGSAIMVGVIYESDFKEIKDEILKS